MTRIAVLKREEMDAEQGKVFDDVKAEGGPVGGPYWAYIRFPKLMRMVQDLSNGLGQGGLSKRERQIAILAIVRFWGAEYPWAAGDSDFFQYKSPFHAIVQPHNPLMLRLLHLAKH